MIFANPILILSLLAIALAGCSKSSVIDGGADGGGLDGGAIDDLSSTLEPIRANGGLPSLAAAVFRGDELIALGATGVRKLGDATAVTSADKWHLGSDTKAMTATLAGISIDRGKLHFEDSLGTLFAGEQVDPGYASVTIEQLMQHRGGAPGNMPGDIWSQMWADGAAPGARLKAVRALLSRPPAQNPGTFVYANAGYMIVGVALERIAGVTWEQLIQTELFIPLQMDGCGFGAPAAPGQVDQPWGHSGSSTLTPVAPGPQADNPPSLGPAGTVHCPLRSWGKFLSMHVAGARGAATLVTAATMLRLHTPPAGGDYAAGWGVLQRSWAGGVTLTHNGSNTMWYATTWLAPAKNLTFSVVTNCASSAAPGTVDAAFGPLIQRYAN